jgi:hypothetical protein
MAAEIDEQRPQAYSAQLKVNHFTVADAGLAASEKRL